jgi:hypothetical protein
VSEEKLVVAAVQMKTLDKCNAVDAARRRVFGMNRVSLGSLQALSFRQELEDLNNVSFYII